MNNIIMNKKFPKGIEVVGSSIIENNKGEILLAQSPKWHNKWTLPGGHIKQGETIKDALVREAEEETGLKVKYISTFGHGELIGSKDFERPAHFVYFDIHCQTDSTKVILDNKELTEYVWIKPAEALKLDLGEDYDLTIKNYIKYKQLK